MKSTKRHVYGLILVLTVVGLSIFFYRHLWLDVPLTDTETVNSWMVEANLKFVEDKNVTVKASFFIPYMPPSFAILDEYFVSHNYGVTTNLVGYNRQTVWTLRRGSGTQSLYYRAIFREVASNEHTLSKPPVVKVQPLAENVKSAVETLSGIVRQSSADIQSFAQGTVRELNKKDGHARLLVGSEFSDDNIINAAITVLNQAKIMRCRLRVSTLLNRPRLILNPIYWFITTKIGFI